jgi:cytochrome c-type biogenesis protein
MSGVGLLTAMAAGLLSFLSPCVLPLIPAYLSLVSGYGLADIRAGSGRFRVLARTLAFAAGFTIVFTALGLLFSGASMLLGGLSRTITLVAGILVIILGFNLVFDFIKVLDLEARFHAAKAPRGYAGAFLVGMAFAAGWSPCVGPILASILLFASREGNALRSVLLLLAYSIGLAAPFIAAGLFFDRLTPLLAWFKRRAQGVRIASGLLLVALGGLMALGRLASLSSVAARAGDALKAAAEASPDAARLIAAGLWALVAASIVALPAMRRRGAVPGRGQFSPVRIAFTLAFAIIALGDLFKIWSTANIVAGWLSFQGV